MHFTKKTSILLLFALLLFSCKKEQNAPEKTTPADLNNGILVMNEGLMNQNNSSLSWIDLSTDKVKSNVFLEKNGRLLGDTGNDMVAYGSKIYITVTGSSTVEVLSRSSLKSIKQIPFTFGGQPQQPRQITKGNGMIFISSFDGYVTVIDTTSLAITQHIKVGRNPEGICFHDNAVYVTNSGGLDAPNYDSTVMKIDVSSYTITDTFVVGDNPGDIFAAENGFVYVVKQGNYSNNPSELVQINAQTGTVTNLGIPTTSLAIKDQILYLSYYNFFSGASTVSLYDCTAQALTHPNFISTQDITTLYGVIPLPNNQVICLDAMNFTNSGYVKLYSSTGQFIKSINVGLNPANCIYYE